MAKKKKKINVRPPYETVKMLSMQGFFWIGEVMEQQLSVPKYKHINYNAVHKAAITGKFAYKRASNRFFIAVNSARFKAWLEKRAKPVEVKAVEAKPTTSPELEKEVASLKLSVESLVRTVSLILTRLESTQSPDVVPTDVYTHVRDYWTSKSVSGKRFIVEAAGEELLRLLIHAAGSLEVMRVMDCVETHRNQAGFENHSNTVARLVSLWPRLSSVSMTSKTNGVKTPESLIKTI